MDEKACLGGQNDTTVPRCAKGYEGPKCGLCSDNYYKAGDQSCQQCAGFGGKMNARLIYGVFGFIFGMIFFFLFWAYLRNDDGNAVWILLSKYLCVICRRYNLHIMVQRWAAGGHDVEALKRLQDRSDKKTASEVSHDAWFRPEKIQDHVDIRSDFFSNQV